ncbi:MAG: purine-nucleoside phosphorylase [Chloroflexi bacterium]|nr:purine-nucleoside phosphorylase [Chloroflexota bacterium]
MSQFGRSEIEAALAAVRERTQHQPHIGLVLGSGLGPLAQSIDDAVIIPTEELPHWPVSTVQGHAGKLYLGTLEGQSVIALRGRSHLYEGYHPSQVALSIRVMQLMGVHTVILTNAAGGLNEAYTPGDLMLIADHINFVGLAGLNPLLGANDERLGPRFPSMTHVYDRELRQRAREIAQSQHLPLQEGVYVGIAGPSFETPAEIRFLRMIGADAVGMSTVVEATAARHGGMRVLGISGITNKAVDSTETDAEPTHEEVLEASKLIAPRMEALLRGVLRGLPRDTR